MQLGPGTASLAYARLIVPFVLFSSRCQDSIAFLSGPLSVILKVQTDETQLKITKKGNFFFFQPLSLLVRAHSGEAPVS